MASLTWLCRGKKQEKKGKNPQRLYVKKVIPMNLDTRWIVGFTDGEGCFHIEIKKHSEMALGFQVLPEFVLSQHLRSEYVLSGIKDFFQAGVIRSGKNDMRYFRVRHQKELQEIILPFFLKHPLKTKKQLDFLRFRDVCLLIETKKHLTPEGLAEIRKIKSKMNS